MGRERLRRRDDLHGQDRRQRVGDRRGAVEALMANVADRGRGVIVRVRWSGACDLDNVKTSS